MAGETDQTDGKMCLQEEGSTSHAQENSLLCLEKLYCKISDTHSPLFPIFNKEVQEEEAEP